jgi:rhamnulokinase
VKIRHYIACDLGAESGRIILGTFNGEILTVEEVHRFGNAGVKVRNTLRWDIEAIFEEILTGLEKVGQRGISPDSVSCDSWGVDYVLMDKQGALLSQPFHYRDQRNAPAFQRALQIVSAEEIFEETGIQFMPINTLYQLVDDLEHRPEILTSAHKFLTIADYFNYRLSGVAVIEESLASTTQIYNPHTRTWSSTLIRRFGFPPHIFPKIVPSGTNLAQLRSGIEDRVRFSGCRVIAGCSHDTAAAVAGIPARGKGWAYLSSGTWSLLGTETHASVITALSREFNFTNEIGFGGTVRLLKNIPGMWIVQECKRRWKEEGREYSYDELTQLAEDTRSSGALINPLDNRFVSPDDMPGEIRRFCLETGQPVPESAGAIVRCILESLAHSYKEKLEQLETVAGFSVDTLHVVGGGSRNALLNRLTTIASGRKVLAGPAESSAVGNILAQAISLGHISTLEEGRAIVEASFSIEEYSGHGVVKEQRS